MDAANPKLKLSKTDLCRFLNENIEQWPELVSMRERYMEKCNRARRIKVGQFGFWLKDNHPVRFDKIYRQALKQPGLLEQIYTDSNA